MKQIDSDELFVLPYVFWTLTGLSLQWCLCVLVSSVIFLIFWLCLLD